MLKILGAALCATALAGSVATAVPSATPAGAATTSATTSAANDAPTVMIKPRALDRGPEVTTPHLEGRFVVDGDIRLRVRGKQRHLLGRSGDGYVVVVLRGEDYRAVRIRPGRRQRVLFETSPGRSVLSADGSTMATVDRIARRTSIDVRSAVDGALIASRGGFRGYPSILDVAGDHVLTGSFENGAHDWDVRADTVEKVSRKPAYEADLGTDRLAYFTADPYDGGCSVVTTVSPPRATLWRSCREAVLAFSPDGERLVTTHKLADGLGPAKVVERTVRGDRLATYRVPFFFGLISWESSTDLVLDSYAKKQGALVRCSEGDCERASDLRPTPRL